MILVFLQFRNLCNILSFIRTEGSSSSSASVQTLCVTSLWEMYFYDHCVQRCLALERHCYNKEGSTLALDLLISIPSNCSHQGFSSSQSSHSPTEISSFFLYIDLLPFSHQMKNTCRGLLILVFHLPWLFNGKGKTEDNSLLCKRV